MSIHGLIQCLRIALAQINRQTPDSNNMFLMYPPTEMSHVAFNKTIQSMTGEEVADTVENQKLLQFGCKMSRTMQWNVEAIKLRSATSPSSNRSLRTRSKTVGGGTVRC